MKTYLHGDKAGHSQPRESFQGFYEMEREVSSAGNAGFAGREWSDGNVKVCNSGETFVLSRQSVTQQAVRVMMKPSPIHRLSAKGRQPL